MILLKTRVQAKKKDQRVACSPKVEIFKLHELWASSRNGFLLVQHMS